MLVSMQSRRSATAPVAPPDLNRLIRNIATGDAAALAALYDATVTQVYSVALRIAGSRQDAEEITCDVYRQIWQTARSFVPERASAMAWLQLLSRSRALDCCRRKSVRREGFLHPVSADGAYTDCEEQSADRLLMALEESSLVRRAVAKLPRQRQVLIGLAFLEGLSHEQIATRTGLALGTVKSHIRRGLNAMKIELDGCGLHDENI